MENADEEGDVEDDI